MKTIKASDLKNFIKPRSKTANKGNFGHLLLIAGDKDRLGAGYLASLAALRLGVGLLTYAMPEIAYKKFDARYPEIMPMSLKGFKSLKGCIDRFTAIAIGPAIGTNKETIIFFKELLKNAKVPIVIDADGLNILSKLPLHEILPKTILTPHPGEMARLIGRTVQYVQKNREAVAKKFAVDHKVIMVLKGNNTVVALPDGKVHINTTGNPGMATAGTGDVLTGMIGSLLAQGLDAEKSVFYAVYLHGLAGDLAAKKVGETSLIASDLINEIPRAMKIITL